MKHPLKTIVKKMFAIAKIKQDISKINLTDESEPYFHKYSWTAKQQEEFRTWLIDYLMKHKKARDEFLEMPTTNKKFISRAVDGFLFCHGLAVQESVK